MELLSALDLKQLGAAAIPVATFLWLYVEERKERKFWQNRSFDESREYLKERIEDREFLKSILSELKA